jgi:trehalose-6-phosphatase
VSESRIALLATDYDGTLSPLDSSREESRLPTPLDAVLRGIAGKAKLAVITSKSFEFIFDRIPYAHAWGCVSGLDLRFKDGTEIAASPRVDVEAELKKAKTILGDSVAYEEKRGSRSLLGFSVDWRGRSPPGSLEEAIESMTKGGLHVSREASNPFVDFFCTRPDKGAALAKIKASLKVSGPAMFMGDSPSDNPAFREADIAVGVDNGQMLDALECHFVVSHEGVPAFLKSLYERDMTFAAVLPGVLKK